MNPQKDKLYHRKLASLFSGITFILLVGTVFYHYAEGWRFIDAAYFSAVTMTTVGYGDITPATDIGKLFTIFYLFTSVGIAFYALNTFATHYVEHREEQLRSGKIDLPAKKLGAEVKRIFNYDREKIVEESPVKKS